MNEDEMRGALVAAMESSARGNTYAQWTDTILPTVRRIVTEELRSAADAITKNGRPDLTTVDQVRAVNEAAQWLDNRADSLDPHPPRGRAMTTTDRVTATPTRPRNPTAEEASA